MKDRDFRLRVDPDGTLWVDVREEPESLQGFDAEIISGTDPDDPAKAIPVSARDLAEINRLIDTDDVSEGHRPYK